MGMNRQQRRAEQRRQIKRPSTLWTPERRQEELYKNGITEKDLAKAYRDGAEECRVMLAESLVKQIYAAVAIAAKEQYGFGRRRLKRLLRAIDDIITMNVVNSDDAIEEAWRKTGLKMDFRSFERVVDADA